MRKIKLKGNMLEVRRSSLITSLWSTGDFVKLIICIKVSNYFSAHKGTHLSLTTNSLGQGDLDNSELSLLQIYH